METSNWLRVFRILMHHPTSVENRKQFFFLMSVNRRRNTSKPAWTNAVTSLPLWFHVMEWLEMKPGVQSYYETLQEKSQRNQDSRIPKHQISLTVNAAKGHASPRAIWANIPSVKMEPASDLFEQQTSEKRVSREIHSKYLWQSFSRDLNRKWFLFTVSFVRTS